MQGVDLDSLGPANPGPLPNNNIIINYAEQHVDGYHNHGAGPIFGPHFQLTQDWTDIREVVAEFTREERIRELSRSISLGTMDSIRLLATRRVQDSIDNAMAQAHRDD